MTLDERRRVIPFAIRAALASVAVALFLLARRLIGARPGSAMPLLIVTLVEIGNEGLDFVRYRVSGWPWTPWGTIGDVLNTLFWPAVLTWLARRGEMASSTKDRETAQRAAR